ncbi:MAG: adenylate/guanylate cyclase domain-containing protein [Bacteroidota bacterium]
MKVQTKAQIRNIFTIMIAYAIIGAIITLYDHLILVGPLSRGTADLYDFWEIMTYNVGAGLVSGILGGCLLTFINFRLKKKPFVYSLIVGGLGFTTVFALVAITITFISLEDERGDPRFTAILQDLVFSNLQLNNLIVWAIIFQLTQFFLLMQQKFGPGNMSKILLGKYHTPKIEPRVFMFLDLKSSTTIAEQLGESKYHQFLQDVFADITEPVGENKAEIYQYVGDEIVVTWHLDKLRNKSHCVGIFFAIESIFAAKEQAYLEKYGTVPQFKAGAHLGNSIVGEIGIIKRDITYSGDLLNTTARIQGKCNELESAFLISGQLREYLADSLEDYHLDRKGFIALRGKATKVELFSVSQLAI